MNINMKYYIVTICAIFIALGVGMLVGFNLNYDQALSKQQSEVLESFNTEFEELKDKNTNLQSEIEVLDGNIELMKSYVNKNIDVLVAEKLTDKSTGIILTRENNDYSEEIEQLISNANGSIAFNIVVKDDKYNTERLDSLSKELNQTFSTSQDVVNYIVERLNDTNGYDELYKLDRLGAIKINNIDEDKFGEYDSVVLIGEVTEQDAQKQFDEKEKIIIQSLKEKNKYLVAVSKSGSNDELLKLYSQNNISTVDDIESIGRVSLTTLLQNQNIVGSYGTSDLAKELIAHEKTNN